MSFLVRRGQQPGSDQSRRLTCHHPVRTSQQGLHSFKDLPLRLLIVQPCPICQKSTNMGYYLNRTFDYFLIETGLISAFPNGPIDCSAATSIDGFSPGTQFEIQTLYCRKSLGMLLIHPHGRSNKVTPPNVFL